MKIFSCINIYAHSCLKPLSNALKAVFKRLKPCLNHGIYVLFEYGFYTKILKMGRRLFTWHQTAMPCCPRLSILSWFLLTSMFIHFSQNDVKKSEKQNVVSGCVQWCQSHPVGLDVWILVGPFIYFHTSWVQTAKALARLRGCAGSPEPSLVAKVISTIISWAGSFVLYLVINVCPTTIFIKSSTSTFDIAPGSSAGCFRWFLWYNSYITSSTVASMTIKCEMSRLSNGPHSYCWTE